MGLPNFSITMPPASGARRALFDQMYCGPNVPPHSHPCLRFTAFHFSSLALLLLFVLLVGLLILLAWIAGWIGGRLLNFPGRTCWQRICLGRQLCFCHVHLHFLHDHIFLQTLDNKSSTVTAAHREISKAFDKVPHLDFPLGSAFCSMPLQLGQTHGEGRRMDLAFGGRHCTGLPWVVLTKEVQKLCQLCYLWFVQLLHLSPEPQHTSDVWCCKLVHR